MYINNIICTLTDPQHNHREHSSLHLLIAKRMEGDCGIDNLKATELRLGLPGSKDAAERPTRSTKRSREGELEGSNDQEITRVAKAQVVGWPPVRSCRKNSFRAKATADVVDAVGMYVKVSMDGAPYLRKIDLKVYKGYKELREGLEDLFKCVSLGELLGLEGCNDSDYAMTYEDKDGDWMLVGDVPWGIFISCCKRLRIMRGSEARGLGSNQ